MTSKQLPNRQTTRIKKFDYSTTGAYFVTICTQNKGNVLGKIKNGVMGLNEVGCMVAQLWQKLTEKYPNAELDQFVIMPNHMHGVMWLCEPVVVTRALENPSLAQAQSTVPTNKSNLQNNVGVPYEGVPKTGTQKVGVPLVGTRKPEKPKVGVPLVGTPTYPKSNQLRLQGITTTGKMTLADIIGAFKSLTTNSYICNVKTKNWPRFNKRFWQPNYYEHIIRNDHELHNIRQYIINNPAKWQHDQYNAKNTKQNQIRQQLYKLIKPLKTDTIYVFGNSDYQPDALAINMASQLQEYFLHINFQFIKPNADLPFIGQPKVHILDVVKGIKKPEIFPVGADPRVRPIPHIKSQPRTTAHDYDLGFQLKYLLKLGKLKQVYIIGLPQYFKTNK